MTCWDRQVKVRTCGDGASDKADGADLDIGTDSKPKADLEPVFYSSAGEAKPLEDTGAKVSASV